MVLIGPALGGLPLTKIVDTTTKDNNRDSHLGRGRVEGVDSMDDVLTLLRTHSVVTWTTNSTTTTSWKGTGWRRRMDAFPPSLMDEIYSSGQHYHGSSELNLNQLSATNNNDHRPNHQQSSLPLSKGDLKVFVQLVHHSELPSKDKVVDHVRTHPTLALLSRAQAVKTLELVADKTKFSFGYLWQVKPFVLEMCGMMTANPDEATTTPTSRSSPTSTKAGRSGTTNNNNPSSDSSPPFSSQSAIPRLDHGKQRQKEYLRRMAQHVHHSTATSKEKLAEELLTACNNKRNDDDDDAASPTNNNGGTTSNKCPAGCSRESSQQQQQQRTVTKAEC